MSSSPTTPAATARCWSAAAARSTSDRPQTCRTYDCRVFAATGIEPHDGLIAERTARWRFTYASEADRARHEAMRTTAVAIRERSEGVNATEQAVRAVEAADAA